MTKRNRIVTLSVALAALFAAPPAFSQDLDQKLEERIQRTLDKRKQVVGGNPLYLGLVNELDTGRKHITDRKWSEAFNSFDRILANERLANYPEYSFAKYYLAYVLYEMKVAYGSLLYFVDIVEKEPVQPHTFESLRRAISIAQELKDDELILYLASTIPPEKVPLSLREEFRYFIAKDLYEKLDYDTADKWMGSIPRRNRLFLAAEYVMGAMAVKRNNLRGAIAAFRLISDTRSPVEYYENQKIRQLANLALGRIFYEMKNYPLSIVYYKKVKEDGEFYPPALYEASWALFKMHKFNESLSVLHSVQSPFFEQIYFLKSYLLSGAIYLELCLYQDAVGTLKGVEDQFTGLGRDIDRFARQAQSPREYYPLLSSKVRKPDGSEAYAYRSLFNLAAAERDFLGVHHYIERLASERKNLADLHRPRADLLSKLLQQRSGDLVLKASYLAGQKLLKTRRMIQDFLDIKDLLRYEVVSAERKILQTRSLRLAPPVLTDAELIKPEFTDSLKETMMWWDYSGEFWKDEVGSYLYNLKSRCKEIGETAK
ncbi:MAG: hypothetical protein V1495_07970 [Pseudomonadota bacterium]